MIKAYFMRGRRSIPTSDRRNTRIIVVMTEAEREKIKAEAEKNHLSISSWARQALSKLANQEES